MVILITNFSNLGVEVAHYLDKKGLLESVVWQQAKNPGSRKRRLLRAIKSVYLGRFYYSGNFFLKKFKINRIIKKYESKFVCTQNINSSLEVTKLLRNSNASIALVIGGKILSIETIQSFGGKWVNLHGGILPDYRGLDSEYWACRNCDFDKIGFTLHLLTEEIDKGQILMRQHLMIGNTNQSLLKVQKSNSRNGLLLAQIFIDKVESGHSLSELSDQEFNDEKGKYFSSAPAGTNFRNSIRNLCQK